MGNNKFYNELVAILNASTMRSQLDWMAAHGQSIILNYGEDNRQWEVSWITGDNRFTAVRGDVREAVKDVLGMVRNEMLEKGVQ